LIAIKIIYKYLGNIMGVKNRIQFGYFKEPVPQEATILYDAAGNEIERVYGDITASQFQSRNDIVRVVGGTSTRSIGALAFYNNIFNLNSVSFPFVTTMGNNAFGLCGFLVNANFPLLTAIPDYGFQSNDKLSNINIPRVSSIGFGGLQLNLVEPNTLKLNLPRNNIDPGAFTNSRFTTIRLRPAPDTPAGWTIGSGQIIGGNTNPITVVADWTDWPN